MDVEETEVAVPAMDCNSEQSSNAAVETERRVPMPMSKNQQKRQIRYEKALKNRQLKRAAEKARLKEKRQKLRESGQIELLQKPIFHEMANSKCPYTQMNDLLIRKTFTQLNFAYAANRRAENPLQYHIAHLNGRTKMMFDELPGYKDWDVYQHQESILELWPPEQLIYLTADSNNIIDKLDPHKVYVIGGLLDRNQYPGLSKRKAEIMKTGHARLPIDEHVKLHTRKVLTINQVFEILLRYYQTNSWEEAFFSVIPRRKGLEKREALVINDLNPPHVLTVEEPQEEVVDISETQQPTLKTINSQEDVIVIDDDEKDIITIE
ncbi:TRNA methyltransferase 10-like protein A [Aphelenchoides besseyi]|nr:TRNA methyltransferase 10-like protein A [Aphelenchoides besseyi]KAI6236438.1 TRNA methyltransferase 10-like protein A [Aphelenchoides besseyi]